jgi:hypothetical protein
MDPSRVLLSPGFAGGVESVIAFPGTISFRPPAKFACGEVRTATAYWQLAAEFNKETPP